MSLPGPPRVLIHSVQVEHADSGACLPCSYPSPSIAEFNPVFLAMAPPEISDDLSDDDEPNNTRTAVDIALRTVSAVRDLVPREAAKGPLSVLCSFLTLIQVCNEYNFSLSNPNIEFAPRHIGRMKKISRISLSAVDELP